MEFKWNMQKCTVSGHELAYHRSGAGETILLVHGITTYSFIWRRIIPLLHRQYDVIALDLLGCGSSDMPLDADYSINSHAERLYQFISALGIDKIHLVGHDIGGGIGQIFAVTHPERLHDLTLINSVAYDFWPVQPIIAMRTPIIRQLAMATLDLGTFKLIVRRGLHNKENLTSELMDYFWKPMKSRLGRKAFLHFTKCLDSRHLTGIAEDLRKLANPVLIIRGDADVYLSAAISEKLHAEIPGSKLVRMERAGHFIQEDVPEDIVSALAGFLGGTL